MQRNVLLDGMRGVAASMVVLYHFGHAGMPALALSGHLAVDFFFVLSGFVIAAAFEHKLTTGMTVGRFVTERLIRFYPLYAVGLLLGIANIIVSKSPVQNPAVSVFFNTVMLPDPFSKFLYPLNYPAWSLAYELAVNVLFAVILFKLSNRVLAVVVFIAAAVIAVSIEEPYWLSVGFSWETMGLGVARTIFAFCVGMLIFRLRSSARYQGWIVTVPIIVLVVLLAVRPPDEWRNAYELTVALIVCPALVWVCAHLELPRMMHTPMVWLGEASFALYAIHHPLIGFAKRATVLLPIHPVATSLLTLGGLLIISWALARHLDEPVRRIARAALLGWRRADGRMD